MYNDLFSVGPLTVHTYGLCIGIGIAAALLLIWRRAERRGMDTQDVNRLVLLVLVTGFAGAKLFYLFAHMDEFPSDPRGAVGALSTSQFIALFTAAAAIVLLISRKRGKTHG